MAYQLQPGLSIVENPAVPVNCATDEVFVYPQPSTLNNGSSRPNTMLYGGAIHGGKVLQRNSSNEWSLRPQSTTRFNRVLMKRTSKTCSHCKTECKLPLRTISYEPMSTRSEVQNGMFNQRYVNKNINKK